MKRNTILLALLALPLAACSGGTDPSAPAGSPSEAAPDISVGATGDAFCDLAVASIAPADDVVEASDELTALLEDPAFLSSTDVGPLNELGEQILEYSDASLVFYTQAVALVDDPAVVEALAGMGDFIGEYTVALGNAAATATSPLEFLTTVGTTFADPALLAVAETAPEYAETISAYAQERCGIAVDVSE